VKTDPLAAGNVLNKTRADIPCQPGDERLSQRGIYFFHSTIQNFMNKAFRSMSAGAYPAIVLQRVP
jgi:hypothetical protein